MSFYIMTDCTVLDESGQARPKLTCLLSNHYFLSTYPGMLNGPPFLFNRVSVNAISQHGNYTKQYARIAIMRFLSYLLLFEATGSLIDYLLPQLSFNNIFLIIYDINTR